MCNLCLPILWKEFITGNPLQEILVAHNDTRVRYSYNYISLFITKSISNLLVAIPQSSYYLWVNYFSAHILCMHTCRAQKLVPEKGPFAQEQDLVVVFFSPCERYYLEGLLAGNTPLHIITRDALIMPGHRKTICGAWEASPDRIFKIMLLMRELHICSVMEHVSGSLWVYRRAGGFYLSEICELTEATTAVNVSGVFRCKILSGTIKEQHFVGSWNVNELRIIHIDNSHDDRFWNSLL